MSLHVNDGGTWKEVQNLSVHDGGSWKDVAQAWIKDGGEWKIFYPPESGYGWFGGNFDYSANGLNHVQKKSILLQTQITLHQEHHFPLVEDKMLLRVM